MILRALNSKRKVPKSRNCLVNVRTLLQKRPCYLSAVKTQNSCQNKLKQVSCSQLTVVTSGVLRMALMQHPQHRVCKIACFAFAYSLKWGVPQACHTDMIFDLGASMFQNLRASKHKFSSQLRLCVTWASHSIPDLSFPICDFSCPGPCQTTIMLFVQGLDRMKSIQGNLPFFKNICSGFQNGSCCIAGTTPRSELFVDFLLLNH